MLCQASFAIMVQPRLPSLARLLSVTIIVLSWTSVQLTSAAALWTNHADRAKLPRASQIAASLSSHPYMNHSLATFNNTSMASTSSPDILEWTALGDSYASGVGTTNYVEGLRCLRYDQAYPVLMSTAEMGGQLAQTQKLNNVVCSGAEIKDILAWQLLDTPTWGQPSLQFGNRPAFGSPRFATLTAGGDDIDFPGILFNCILGIHIKGGPTKRTCTDQQSYTWGLLNSGQYIQDLGPLIDAIMTKGRSGPAGNDFRLYLTGYGRFFNADTPGSETNCDSTTFVDGLISGNPIGSQGASDAILTQGLRQTFNDMADSLNTGIQKAVTTYNDPNVKFVDIQTDASGNDVLAGHRFCETGVHEPDTNNANLYFWHYPYAASSSVYNTTLDIAAEDAFDTAYAQVWDDAGSNINTVYPNYNQFLDVVLEQWATQMNRTGDDEADIWGGVLGYRTRIFHPQLNWHQYISATLLKQYALDVGGASSSANSTGASPSPSPASSTSPPPSTTTSTPALPSATDTCKTKYEFFFDHFEIYGQNFNATLFGTDGSGLKQQLSGCGALTGWKFTNLQNDANGMQWYAAGNLPIGDKACIGRAVVSAGPSCRPGAMGRADAPARDRRFVSSVCLL